MSTYQLRPWSQVVRLHPDVESGSTAVSAYAIDLGALVRGDNTVPRTYRQARDFFAATHLTGGLRRLLEDVLTALGGGSGDRVLQLRSPFGGGKSHTLAALYHAAQERAALNELPDGLTLPDPGPVRVAVFDGEKFGVRGELVNGQRVQTLWGALAAQLNRYDVMAHYDNTRGAPGGNDIREMLGENATLILFDEVLKYIERVLAEPVGDSTLGRQTQEFLQTLSVEVANTSHTVLVYSLQASAHEAFGDTALLQMLDHLTSRVDAKREPVEGDEILPVLRRRLLAEAPPAAASQAVAESYADEITRMRTAYALDDGDRRAAEDERLVVRDRFRNAYPFHPALIDLMRERWASLPHFQRTRGALRFLAVCLHALKRENRAGALLGPGDIPMDDGDVAQAFFTEVGQREPFRAVLQRDFSGPNARVPRIDARFAGDRPDLSGLRPAMRMATAILAYSFGGRSQADAAGGDPIAAGVGEDELLAAVLSPELDSITAKAILKELREQCLYLHYDGARYVFKTTANVTQIIEEQVHHIQPEETDGTIREELESQLSGRSGAILWPANSQAIPDREPRFLLVYLPLSFAQKSDSAQKADALALLGQHGETPRRYRNGLGLVIPDRRQVEPLRRAVRYLEAIKLVRERRQQYNLTQAQLEQLNERDRTEKAQFDTAMRDLYQEVWLPKMENGALAVEQVALAGRPLQAATLHERLMELLTIVAPRRVFSSVTPGKLGELMNLGAGPGQSRTLVVERVIDAFFSILDFPRLDSDRGLRKAIAEGVGNGAFGYVGRSGREEVERIREEGNYLLAPRLARMGVTLPEDEISAGDFLVIPEVIDRQESTSTGGGTTTSPPAPGPDTPTPGGSTARPWDEPDQPYTTTSTGGDGSPRTSVRLSLQMNRQQLYSSWQAIANLAERAGVVTVRVEAQRPEGFDPNWLRNAVYEPLEEAGVELEGGEEQ